VYKFYMSTSGFKLAPYSLTLNCPKGTLREKRLRLIPPYRFLIVLIANHSETKRN